MILGNGDLASALQDIKDDKIYFAAGVSNSAETRKSEFVREFLLLGKQDKTKHIVYFSSLCVFYLDTPYSRHKLHIETYIKDNFPRYTIMRLGNITWGKNPHTIINYFRNMIDKGEPIEIQDTYRYLITKEELLHWIGMIPDWNCEMNVPGMRKHVRKIVSDLLIYGKVIV